MQQPQSVWICMIWQMSLKMRPKYDMDEGKVALETVAQQNRGFLSSNRRTLTNVDQNYNVKHTLSNSLALWH